MSDLLKCFCPPKALYVVLGVGIFAAAFMLYYLLLFVGSKLVRKQGIGERLLKQLRFPLLLILLEIAAQIVLAIGDIPATVEKSLRHALYVFMIGTIGWFFAAVASAFYQNFVQTKDAKSRIHRSQLTQVLFLYRFFMFAIVAVTAALMLLTFPYIKNVGLGILGSAGVAGLALGIAARPILLNLMVGFQIAATKMLQIGDTIFIEKECARIESIHLTHVVVSTWDWRRIVIPISYFIDKPFENWDLDSSELLAAVYLYCDYTVPVNAVRSKTAELIAQHAAWNGKVWSVTVSECTDRAIQLRIAASTNDYPSASELRAYLREGLIAFLQKEFPYALPCVRECGQTAN